MLKEVKNIFSKEYKENIAYLEFTYKMRPYVKLKNASESIDNKIERLENLGYNSDCQIKVGEFL